MTLYQVTDKAAGLLLAVHAYVERGTRGGSQRTIKELEDKYINVSSETILALQAALAATTMELDEDLDHYNAWKTSAQSADRGERSHH